MTNHREQLTPLRSALRRLSEVFEKLERLDGIDSPHAVLGKLQEAIVIAEALIPPPTQAEAQVGALLGTAVALFDQVAREPVQQWDRHQRQLTGRIPADINQTCIRAMSMILAMAEHPSFAADSGVGEAVFLVTLAPCNYMRPHGHPPTHVLGC